MGLEGARNDFIALDKASEDVLTERERELGQLSKGEIEDVRADAWRAGGRTSADMVSGGCRNDNRRW